MKHLFIFFISLQIEKKIINLIKHLCLNLQREGEFIKEVTEWERKREKERERGRGERDPHSLKVPTSLLFAAHHVDDDGQCDGPQLPTLE